MINLDFFIAIAGYFTFVILILLGSWVLRNGHKSNQEALATEFLRQCPICYHLFFDYQKEAISLCPKCKSYLKKEEVK